MRKLDFQILKVAITILFFIQMTGTLVESIYVLNLLNTALDVRALGLLFFFSPILLIFFHKRPAQWFAWVSFGLLFFSRGITPYLNTTGRLLSSGVGTAAVMLLMVLFLSGIGKRESSTNGIEFTAGLALGVGLSVFLRSLNYSIDYSLTLSGSWVGWLLGILLGFTLSRLEPDIIKPTCEGKNGRMTFAILGIFQILTLVYFIFSAPGVLARWTEGNYLLIIITAGLVTFFSVALFINPPSWLSSLSPAFFFAWNVAFSLSLLGTILAHRVPFPPMPDSTSVVISQPTLVQQLPTYFMLLLSPIIFLDFREFVLIIRRASPTPRELVPGFILGSFSLILLVFMMIFSNVWGYVEPVSLVFRNKFWFPFALTTSFIIILMIFLRQKETPSPSPSRKNNLRGWVLILGSIFILTVFFTLQQFPFGEEEFDQESLLVMTYNIQAANDQSGEKAFERQLELIREVDPDILALQESDTSRISLNNNDYVRYFSGKLGYYSYYGPKTVTGTFGTAILSRYPLSNTHTIFSYSDQDEIGTAVAEVNVGGKIFTIYNVHPDGSDTAMLVFAKTLLSEVKGKGEVIALGDFNLRKDEIPYQLIDPELINAWTSQQPAELSDKGTDISETRWIDHIFVSSDLQIRNPVYLLPPESNTDHPAHWAEVSW